MDIKHNVEYSLHPVKEKQVIPSLVDGNSITANNILKKIKVREEFKRKNNNLISKGGILRNACTIANGPNSDLVASFKKFNHNSEIQICEQSNKPFAMFECKRVGVEEGNKKRPQTIEKAKQGAYVARTVSALQKVRLDNGELYGIIFNSKNELYSKPYYELLQEIIDSDRADLLKKFILTVGVVSNHGNWFTAEDHNKELKVLAQSYDWLIFLTDQGLASFIEDLLLKPSSEQQVVKDAFLASYGPHKKKNQFTKVQMNADADNILIRYFENFEKTEAWFNIISPQEKKLADLKSDLDKLKSKKWETIL